MKNFIGIFLVFMTISSNAFSSQIDLKTSNTVLYIGKENITEVKISLLREAAEILKATRPELADQVNKAADIISR